MAQRDPRAREGCEFDAIADDSASTLPLATYTYLGLSTIVQQLDANNIGLSYIKQGGRSGGRSGVESRLLILLKNPYENVVVRDEVGRPTGTFYHVTDQKRGEIRKGDQKRGDTR